MRPRKLGAGRYAHQQYRDGLHAWRARTRWISAAIAGPFIVAGIVVLWVDHHTVTWAAGAMFGGAASLWITMRDSPPAYVENWRQGYEGERKTERALAPLERCGWRVMHDIQTDQGNFDHVAVGPGGAYLLETKNLVGVVEMRGRVPYLRRRLIERTDRVSAGTQALRGAMRLHDEIAKRSGETGWVQAVVVFWAEFPAQLADGDRECVFIHGSQLHTWLENRQAKLSPAQVARIAAAVEQIVAPPSDRWRPGVYRRVACHV